jgi:hypothetical protein
MTTPFAHRTTRQVRQPQSKPAHVGHPLVEINRKELIDRRRQDEQESDSFKTMQDDRTKK